MAASVRSKKSSRYKAKRAHKLAKKQRRMHGGLRKRTNRRHSAWK